MISRLTVAVTVLALLAYPIQAAADPDVTWSRRLGELDPAVAVHGGSVFAAGARFVQTATERQLAALVVAFDRHGNVRWRRSWRPAGSAAGAVDIAVTRRGDVYVAGTVMETFGCGGWWLRAYTSDGSLRWHVRRPGGGCGLAQAVAANDRMVVVGVGDLRDGYGTVDGSIVAFGRNGERRWGRSFRVAGYGADQYESVTDLAVTERGRILAVGLTAARPADPTETPDLDGVLTKLSPDGRRLWTRVDAEPWFTSLDVGDGTAVVAGATSSGGRIERIGASGSVRWARRVASHVSFRGGTPIVVSVAGDGGVVAAWSWRRGDERRVVVRAFDDAGERRWTRALPAPDGGWWSTSVDARGGTIAAGGVHGRTRGRVWRLSE